MSRIQCRIQMGNASSQNEPPLFDRCQNVFIDRTGSAFVDRCLNVSVETSFENILFGKRINNVIEIRFKILEGTLGKIFIERAVENSCSGCLIVFVRFESGIVNGELPEVGQDRQCETGGISVTPQLKGGRMIVTNIDGRPLGFDEKLSVSSDSERLIRCFGAVVDFDMIFPDDIAVLFGVPVFVAHVPAEQLEKLIDEIGASVRLVVVRTLILDDIRPKQFDQLP